MKTRKLRFNSFTLDCQALIHDSIKSSDNPELASANAIAALEQYFEQLDADITVIAGFLEPKKQFVKFGKLKLSLTLSTKDISKLVDYRKFAELEGYVGCCQNSVRCEYVGFETTCKIAEFKKWFKERQFSDEDVTLVKQLMDLDISHIVKLTRQIEE